MKLALKLPPIPRDKLNLTTDKDIVSSLESLYYVHCKTIFENIKFMKFESLQKNLFLFSSGSISPQMYSLFISEELYDWIYQCDLITHIELIKFFSNLVINNKPMNDSILFKLDLFAKDYCDYVSKASIDLPLPVVEKKLKIAKKFSNLIKKLIKLFKFIQSFENSFPSFKEGMKKDWQNIINLHDILDMVSNERHQQVMKLIKDFMQVNIPMFLKDEYRQEGTPTTTDTDTDNKEKAVPNSMIGFMEALLQFISDEGKLNASGNVVVDCFVRFTNTVVGDISLKSADNLLPWLFVHNITVQLLHYSLDVSKFIKDTTT